MSTTRRFRQGQPLDQPFLLPPALTDWLPAKHPVYAWDQLVDELDLTPILRTYGPKGQPPYDPRIMVKILIYGYAQGIQSSRQLERACWEDVAFRVLSRNQQPDFWTLATFRRRHLTALGNLLQQSVQLAAAVGLVKLKDVAIDGTKVKASASKHRAMSYAHLQEREADLAAEIQGYLDGLEAADRADDATHGAEEAGWTVPPELADAQRRQAVIQAAKARLEAQAQERATAVHAEKVAQAEAAGKPAPPPPATPAEPDPKAQTNFTDPDSRIMRNSDKAFIQGYNAQVAVDADSQIILAATVTNQAADSPHLLPVLDQVRENTGRTPRGVLADAGYWSEKNLDGCAEREVPAAIPPEKLKHRVWRSATAPRGRIPQHLSGKDRMRRYLRTKAGRRRYRRRQCSVEPAIGYLKTVQGCRQFLLRSLAKVDPEWRFHCAVANLARILRRADRLTVPGRRGRLAWGA
jgi:transposase